MRRPGDQQVHEGRDRRDDPPSDDPAGTTRSTKITPKSIERAIIDPPRIGVRRRLPRHLGPAADAKLKKYNVDKPDDFRDMIEKMRKEMHAAADDMDFERAAELRDKIKEMESLELSVR